MIKNKKLRADIFALPELLFNEALNQMNKKQQQEIIANIEKLASRKETKETGNSESLLSSILETFFLSQGYIFHAADSHQGHGFDYLAANKLERIGVELKSLRDKVDLDTVEHLFSRTIEHDLGRFIIVSTSSFTDAALSNVAEFIRRTFN